MTKVVNRTCESDGATTSTERAKPLTPEDAARAANAPCKCECGLVFYKKRLRVGNVEIEPALQMRVALDDAAIREYADHYERDLDDKLMEGEKPYDLVEAVEVAGGRQVVAHGFHRRSGMTLAQMADMAWEFLLARGTMAQAAKHAARANRTSASVRYTGGDKENACKKLWAVLGGVSVRNIAELAGVAAATAKKHQPPELLDKPSRGKDGVVRKPPTRKPTPPTGTGQNEQSGRADRPGVAAPTANPPVHAAETPPAVAAASPAGPTSAGGGPGDTEAPAKVTASAPPVPPVSSEPVPPAKDPPADGLRISAPGEGAESQSKPPESETQRGAPDGEALTVLITNFTGTISAIETFAHRMPRKPLMKILTLIADAHLQKHQVLAADLKPLLARRDLGTRVERLRNLLVTESDVTRTAAQQEFGVTAQTLDAALGSSKLSDAIVTGLEEAWRRAVVHVRERVGIENVLHSDDVDDANGSELMIDDGPTEAA